LQKPTSQCYVIDQFIKTLAHRSDYLEYCTLLYVAQGLSAVNREIALINQRQTTWVSEHSMQNTNVALEAAYMDKYCRYILAKICLYDTSATLSYRFIYIGMLMDRSNSICKCHIHSNVDRRL